MIKYILLTISLLFTVLLFQQNSYAVIEAVEFKTKPDEKRYKKLISQLRCLVCQNQNLADSDAPLAKDLRNITETMIKNGDSDSTIKAFMRERYGYFVLYEPPFNAYTAFIWIGPFVLLIGVSAILLVNIRRRQEDELFKPTRASDDAERVKIRNLLRDTPSIANESTSLKSDTTSDKTK